MKKPMPPAMLNAKNGYQGNTKKVLCVCSAGLLRSPTVAEVLTQEPFRYNTRAAGLYSEYALVPVTENLLHWADEVVCMNYSQAEELNTWMSTLENQYNGFEKKPVHVLNLPDEHMFRAPELVELSTVKLKGLFLDGQ